MCEIMTGQIEISPKVASRKDGEEFILLHVPSDRYVVLDHIGQKTWEKIEKGTCDITTLIKEHAEENKIPTDVAAYQVIAFLDELRDQGFVKFILDKERDTAPLLDVPLSELSPQILKQVAEKTLKGDGSERKVILLDSPRADLTLRDVKQVAERISEADISQMHRAIIVDTSRSDLSLRDVKKIIRQPSEIELPGVRRVAILDNPKSNLSLKDIANFAPQDSLTTTVHALARIVIIIIIITDGPIIIIVIGGGPGPTRGRSASACKTMCV